MNKNSKYSPAIKDRWTDEYFVRRKSNDLKRLRQFELDKILIHKFINEGNICDVGCSTGEFMKYMNWKGNIYGMEIHEGSKKIASEIISFDKDIFTEKNFFDVIIFRGTIQHVDEPFRMIKSSYNALKKDGYIVFLSTPNSEAILYKIKKNLPNLNWKLNFYIPGEKSLKNALVNYNFKICYSEFPYLETPYANLLKDHMLFILNLFSKKFYRHAFWRNSMNIIAKKVDNI